MTASGPMGPGWSLPWQAGLSVQVGLSVQASGDVVLTAENGDQFGYASNGDGTFTASAGPRSVLAAVMSGSAVTGYTLTAPDNHVLAFSASGQHGSIEDATGRGITLGYSGAQVTSLTDAAGQSVSLACTGGLLTQVGLPDGQAISYGYSGGLLTSVTTPGGAGGQTTHYGYNSTGLLASIQDPDGNFQLTSHLAPGGWLGEEAQPPEPAAARQPGVSRAATPGSGADPARRGKRSG